MKPFKGNCQVIRMLEALIVNSNPNCILMDKSTHAPLFEVQKDFESKVITMSYSYIVKNGFFGKEHPLSFRYDLLKDYAEVYMTRELADILQIKYPDLMKIPKLEINMSNGNDNS